MTPEQRKLVTKDQIERFFATYYTNWRLHQILTTEKLLKEKFTFYQDIIAETKKFDDNKGDATIAQEITHGLMFEAIANCIQYIEDLFALLKAGENSDYFIKNIITYKAGQIENFIKYKYSDLDLCRFFYIPFTKEGFKDNQLNEVYPKSLIKLVDSIEQLRVFYLEYQFCYNQYKHGLTVALRPFNLYTEEQINKEKANEFKPYLAVFDNLSVTKLGDKKDRLNDLLFMPCFTENVSRNLHELMKEDNLVRYVFPPQDTTIEKLKVIAYLTRDLINIFAFNLMSFVGN